MRWSGRQSSTALSLRSPFAMRAAIGAYVVGCAIATAVEPARQAQGIDVRALWFEQLPCVVQVGLRKAHIRRRMHACMHACMHTPCATIAVAASKPLRRSGASNCLCSAMHLTVPFRPTPTFAPIRTLSALWLVWVEPTVRRCGGL